MNLYFLSILVEIMNNFTITSITTIDITEDAAREHENWFLKFEDLRAKQKEAIMKWKNEKKNVFVRDCNPDVSSASNKCTDNDAEVSSHSRICCLCFTNVQHSKFAFSRINLFC
jgi:hypothetical protein